LRLWHERCLSNLPKLFGDCFSAIRKAKSKPYRLGPRRGYSDQNESGSGMKPVLRILWEDWADQGLPLPAYETAGAAGADIRANLAADMRETGFVLLSMQRAIVPTGFRVEIPLGFEMQIRPRSGLAVKHGISLPNTPGTIDCDYRGPLGVALINLGAEAYVIQHGDRIAQMIVAPVVQALFEVVDSLSDTARGEGGFGSTGRG
jgi:dUTP pyrophosphatase